MPPSTKRYQPSTSKFRLKSKREGKQVRCRWIRGVRPEAGRCEEWWMRST
ncbi:MAG: hypothetical protein ACKERG_04650 [Candidatus Hodgkinia cicadicola]